MLNRRHSDAALLVLAVATLALVLVATLALHHLAIGDDDAPPTTVLVDRGAALPESSTSPGTVGSAPSL